MKANWEEISKDKYGFFNEESDLYERLPIIITDTEDFYYVDEENWNDTLSDLSKERFKYYIEVEQIPNTDYV